MPVDGWLGSGTMPAVFGQAGMEYAYEHDGVGFEQFAKVAEKNHAHSALNPLAQYQKVFTLEEIMEARVISYPNTLPMCCPTGDGAAAIVLVSESKLKTLSLEQQKRAVKIGASVLTSDPWTEGGAVAARRQHAHPQRGRPGLRARGHRPRRPRPRRAARLLRHRRADPLRQPRPVRARRRRRLHRLARLRGVTARCPVNVSGGLLSKGHPIGMTGAAGVFEITTQLRGEAGDRQIEGAKVGMAHVIGLGSACGIHILEKAAA